MLCACICVTKWLAGSETAFLFRRFKGLSAGEGESVGRLHLVGSLNSGSYTDQIIFVWCICISSSDKRGLLLMGGSYIEYASCSWIQIVIQNKSHKVIQWKWKITLFLVLSCFVVEKNICSTLTF